MSMRRNLRTLLQKRKFIVSMGIETPVHAKIVEQAGLEFAYVGGYSRAARPARRWPHHRIGNGGQRAEHRANRVGLRGGFQDARRAGGNRPREEAPCAPDGQGRRFRGNYQVQGPRGQVSARRRTRKEIRRRDRVVKPTRPDIRSASPRPGAAENCDQLPRRSFFNACCGFLP